MPNFCQENADQNNEDNELLRSSISVEKADSVEETTTEVIEKSDPKKNIDENDVYDKVETTTTPSERRSDKSLPRDASVDALASKHNKIDKQFISL